MKDWGVYEWVSYVLVLIGGINWGLLGLFRIDLFATIFGIGLLNRLFLIIVGVAAGFLCYKYYITRKPPQAPAATPPAV